MSDAVSSVAAEARPAATSCPTAGSMTPSGDSRDAWLASSPNTLKPADAVGRLEIGCGIWFMPPSGDSRDAWLIKSPKHVEACACGYILRVRVKVRVHGGVRQQPRRLAGQLPETLEPAHALTCLGLWRT